MAPYSAATTAVDQGLFAPAVTIDLLLAHIHRTAT